MKIRVCMYPAENTRNDYIKITADAVAATGDVEVIPFSFGRSFFQRFDIFHVHWPDAVVFPTSTWRAVVKFTLFTVFLHFAKIRGKPVVWTAHNMGSHEGRFPTMEAALWRTFFSVVSHIVHLCPQSVDALASWRDTSSIPSTVVPHPSYRSLMPNPPSRQVARQRLGLSDDAIVYLSFGLLRRYKRLEDLVEAFKAWPERRARLIIAGEAAGTDDIVRTLRQLATGDDRIIIEAGRIDNAGLIDRIRACDAVVIANHKVLNSGVANMALAFDRPLLAFRSGCIIDYRNRLGDSWVHYISEPMTTGFITSFAHLTYQHGQDLRADLSFCAPEVIGREMRDVYRSVRAARTCAVSSSGP